MRSVPRVSHTLFAIFKRAINRFVIYFKSLWSFFRFCLSVFTLRFSSPPAEMEAAVSAAAEPRPAAAGAAARLRTALLPRRHSAVER